MDLTIVAIVSGVLGLLIGSFLNVVAYRVPAGLSIAHPPSACPGCKQPIRSYDNIPVLSWLALRGRCRDCSTRISVRYPIVEAATAALFAATAVIVGAMWVLPAYLWFVGLTVALTLTDIDHKLIPNRILYPGTAGSALLLVVGALLDGDGVQLAGAFIGGVAYFVILLVVALIARGGFGFGDVKLAFLLGLFLGYQSVPHVFVALFLAFVGGGLVSLLLLVTRIRSRKDKIPFGPYLIFAAYAAIAFGDGILDWYLP